MEVHFQVYHTMIKGDINMGITTMNWWLERYLSNEDLNKFLIVN